MLATQLIKENIQALLRERGVHAKDLASWCRRGESWISKILTEPKRRIPSIYFDRIADFFGVAVYELFQPGRSTWERRQAHERRSGDDRRKGHRHRAMLNLTAAIEPYRPHQLPVLTPSEQRLLKRVRASPDLEARILALFDAPAQKGSVLQPAHGVRQRRTAERPARRDKAKTPA
jgi:hypothetical protein